MQNKKVAFFSNSTKNYKKWYIGLFVSVIITIIVFWLSSTQFGKEFEAKTLDIRFRKFPIHERADTNIVLVAIDSNSLNFFSQNGISWPWSRDFYAHITDYLTNARAKVVLYDLLFYEADLNRDETDSEETDGAFANAIKNNKKVILAAKFTQNSSDSIPDINTFSVQFKKNKSINFIKFQGGKVPIDTLLSSTKSLGIINVKTDSDGIIRHIPMLYRYKDKYYPQMALSGLLLGNKKSSKIEFRNKKLLIGNVSIPVDKKSNYLINWYNKGGMDKVFKYITFSSVIQSAFAMKTGNTPMISENIFKNKYVIIGTTGPGIEDLIPTPFMEPYPGMELWATVLSNFLKHDFITILPWWINLLNILLISYLIFLIFTKLSPKISSPLIFLLLLSIFGLAIFLWNSYRILLNITMPLFAFVMTNFYVTTISYIIEGKSKREIKKIFTRYLHPDVIDKLMENPESVTFGGTEVYATVLFSDIYNFTTFSEGKKAPELVKDLNEYFENFTEIILKYNGLLDKYTGDGIMAIFGVPSQREDHAILACKAALAHRKFSLQLSKNENSAANNFHLNTRIGLNSGPIVAGNIGSKRRMDYTAIGDDVNLAARLEGVNKIYKTHIIISRSTYNLIQNHFICRELDCLKVKGKSEPTTIYELIDENIENNIEKYSWIDSYQKGLKLYQKGNWKEAVPYFKKLSEGKLKDYASYIMLKRCEEYIQSPPKEWDGIQTLKSK